MVGLDFWSRSRGRETTEFGVETVPLPYCNAVGINNSFPAGCIPPCNNYPEEATLWNDEMKYISWVPAEERVVNSDDGNFGHRLALSVEQKGAIQVRNVVQQLPSSRQTKVDACAGNSAIGRACMWLQRYCCLCLEWDWEHLFKRMLTCCCGGILWTDYYWGVGYRMRNGLKGCRKNFLQANDGFGAKEKKLLWIIRAGWSPQSFPAHGTPFLSNRVSDESLYEMGKASSLSLWLERGLGWFLALDEDTFLPAGCRKADLTLKKSLTRHWWAVICIFAATPFGQSVVPGYNHSSLVFTDLCGR